MIETDRLILRPMDEGDLEDFYEIFSTEEVGRFINKMTHESVERYFEKKRNKPQNPYSFAVVLKENGKMIGTCGVKLDPETNVGTLSYVFNPNYWSKGYCTEACREVMRYCFEEGNMDKIEADCFEDNEASIHVLSKKLNMRAEKGKYREELNSYTQKVTPFKFFAITKEQYNKDANLTK